MSKESLRRSLVSICLGLLIILGAYSRADAQQKPAPDAWKLRPAQLHLKKGSLHDALKQLRTTYSLNFLFDGEPITSAADLDIQGNVSTVLDAVADTYDYTWKESTSGVILMSKRFRNPREQPQTHPAEIRQVAQDVLRLLSRLPFSLEDKRSVVIDRTLTQSFTEEQTQALAKGEWLKVSDMPAAQRDLLSEYVYYDHFKTAYQAWNTLILRLDDIRSSFVKLQQVQLPDPTTGELVTRPWVSIQPASQDGYSIMMFEVPAQKEKKP